MFNRHSAVLRSGKCPVEHATAVSIAASDHLNKNCINILIPFETVAE